MGVLSKLLSHWRKPTGWIGRSALWAMNVSHARLSDWGLKHITIEKHWTILDVGCGGGMTVRKLAALATEGKVYGIDHSEQSVTVSQRTNRPLIEMGRVEIRQGNVSRLPFSDDLFDLVTATDSHYYWPDLASDVREVLRVLKPSATLIIIGEEFRGGVFGRLYEEWADQLKITHRSVDELDNLLSMAGYANAQTFKDVSRGWVCAVATKAS